MSISTEQEIIKMIPGSERQQMTPLATSLIKGMAHVVDLKYDQLLMQMQDFTARYGDDFTKLALAYDGVQKLLLQHASKPMVVSDFMEALEKIQSPGPEVSNER